MGNVVRMVKYDRAANVANAVSALSFHDAPLKWHRLDDGVMGGRSETTHVSTMNGVDGVHFMGSISTEGGGFTSIRAPLEKGLPPDITALRLKFRGDGRTYKCLLSDGTSSGGPMGRSPSWQADLPTKKLGPDDDAEVATLTFGSFVPSFGGSSASSPSRDQYQFDAAEMREVGLMLSLRMSDGRPTPPETFGEGIFSFSLFVESIEPIFDEGEKKSGDDGEAKDL